MSGHFRRKIEDFCGKVLAFCQIFINFANKYATAEMTNERNATHNSLNMRGLQNYPPLFCKINGNGVTADNTASHREIATQTTLLHQALASCGRVFLCLCLTFFLLTFTACEKEIPVDADALTRSAQENDSTARGGLGITVTIDTVWKGETYINY